MGFFSNMYTKEGPGVRKDQPPKKGIPRFFEILMRDYGHLLKVNFLFLLCCLPMVTVVLFGLLFHQYLGMLLIAAVLYLLCAVLVGPAMTCLHGITVKTVRDEPCYMWHEFKKCWKGNWKQSVPAGVLFCTLLAMECIAAWYYMFMQSEMNVLLVAFVAFSLLLLTICWLFTTLQMLYLDMPLGGMLKNSLLIMFGLRQTHAARRADYAGHRHRGGAVRARSHHASAAVPGNACTGGRHRGYVGLARDGAGVPHL